MKIALIACPAWAQWAPHPALLLLGAQLRAASFSVDLYDLNIDSYNHCNDHFKQWWLDQNSYKWEHEKHFMELWNENISFFSTYAETIANTSPDLVGFCINSGSRFCSPCMAKLIKSLLPHTPLIVGGPDCFRSEYFTKHMTPGVVDALCPGEGDLAIVSIACAIEKHGFIPVDMPGFLTWEDGDIRDNGDPERPRILDEVAPVSLSGVSLEKYVHGNRVSLSISRGCIKRCAFCSEGPNFFKFRTHSAEWMINQLSILLVEIAKSTTHMPHINFNDSLINGNMKIMDELCDLIIERDLKFSWGGMAIIRKEMTYEFLKKMKRAGCVELCWGIESGSTRTLNLMRKNLAISLVDEVLRSTHAAGIHQYGNIIIGFPGEGAFEFAESLFFAAKNIHYFTSLGLPVFTPTKNSTVSRIPHKFGMASLDPALWTNTDKTNTPEIRSIRRKLISHIVAGKKFDQGKFTSLEELTRNNPESETIKNEIEEIAFHYASMLEEYLEDSILNQHDFPTFDPAAGTIEQYQYLLQAMDTFQLFCETNARWIPLIPDRVEEGEIRSEIPRGESRILECDNDNQLPEKDHNLPRQWITVSGVEKTEGISFSQGDVIVESPYARQKEETILSYVNFLDGKSVPVRPLEIFLDPGNDCNIEFGMWPAPSDFSKQNSIALKAEDRGFESRGFFDLHGSLESIEEDLKGTLNVHCSGCGEFTVHPNFSEVVEFLSGYDVMLDFITNGMNLDESISQLLVENRVAKITICLSACTREEFESSYPGGIHEQVLAGMRTLADTKELYKSAYPVIEINSLTFEHQVKTLPHFIDLMADHGANVIHVEHKALLSSSGEDQEMIEKGRARAFERGLTFSAIGCEKGIGHSESEWMKNQICKENNDTQDLVTTYIKWYEAKYTEPLLKSPISTIISDGSNYEIQSDHEKNDSVSQSKPVSSPDEFEQNDQEDIDTLLTLINFTLEKGLDIHKLLEFNFDSATMQGVCAWIWAPEFEHIHFDLDIFIDDEKVATRSANAFRSDLLDARKGNGYYSMMYELPDYVNDGSPHAIMCKVTGTHLVLGTKIYIYENPQQDIIFHPARYNISSGSKDLTVPLIPMRPKLLKLS